MKSILSICGDPGGAAAVAPVLLRLTKDQNFALENLAYFRAPGILDQRGVSHRAIANDFSADGIAAVFDRAKPDLLLCGTSMNGWDLEGVFTAEATERGIPSLAVLDFWSNYRGRFCSARRPDPILPTKIAIMDGQAQAEMIAEGFEPDSLVLTGQPAFDDLAEWRSKVTPEKILHWRQQLGVSTNELLVVFVSQPVSAGIGTKGSALEARGFDEHVVVKSLVHALEMLARECTQQITLLIRLHPREEETKFRELQNSHIRIEVTAAGNAREAISAANLVVGINSVLLVEACYLGYPVASLQPNLIGTDTLPTNRLGFSRAAYSDQEIQPTIRELLFDENARRKVIENLARFRPDGNAANRVVEAVYSLLQHSPVSYDP